MDELPLTRDSLFVAGQTATLASVRASAGQSAAGIPALELRLNQIVQHVPNLPSSGPSDAPPCTATTPRGSQAEYIDPLRPTTRPQCATSPTPTSSDATSPRITRRWELSPITPIASDGARVTALIGMCRLSHRLIGDLLAGHADLPTEGAARSPVHHACARRWRRVMPSSGRQSVFSVDEIRRREAGQRHRPGITTAAQPTGVLVTTRRGSPVRIPRSRPGVAGSPVPTVG